MESSKTDFNLNSSNLIDLLWSKRKLILIIGLIALLVSAIASFMITPKYKATAIIYPPIDNQVSKELIAPSMQAGLTVFGESKEVEQLLQVLSSNTLRDLTLKKLNLMSAWGIDPNERYALSKAYGIYNENVQFRATQFMSVEVDVLDKDPKFAAQLANAVVSLQDSLMRSIKAQVASKGLIVIKEQYNQALKEMKALEDSMAYTMKNGVFSLDEQTKGLFFEYAKAVAAGQVSSIKALEKRMEPLKIYGSKYIRYKNEMLAKADQIVQLNTSMKTMEIEAAQGVPSQFVVDYASVPDKKSYPKKSIIIILSTLSAMFFALFAIVISDFIKLREKS